MQGVHEAAVIIFRIQAFCNLHSTQTFSSDLNYIDSDIVDDTLKHCRLPVKNRVMKCSSSDSCDDKEVSSYFNLSESYTRFDNLNPRETRFAYFMFCMKTKKSQFHKFRTFTANIGTDQIH